MQGTALCQIVYTFLAQTIAFNENERRAMKKGDITNFTYQSFIPKVDVLSLHIFYYIYGGAGFRYHIMAQKCLMLIGIGQIIIEH